MSNLCNLKSFHQTLDELKIRLIIYFREIIKNVLSAPVLYGDDSWYNDLFFAHTGQNIHNTIGTDLPTNGLPIKV